MQEEKRGGRTGGNGRKGRIIAFCVVMALAVGAAVGGDLVMKGRGGSASPGGALGETAENTSGEQVKTDENCAVEQTYRFLPCGHSVTRRLRIAPDLAGQGFDAVQAHYANWRVDAFTAHCVEMSRDMEIYCPMHQVLMLDESGAACVFENIYGDGLAIVEKLDASAEDFSEENREKLFQGLGFDDRQTLEEWVRENRGGA